MDTEVHLQLWKAPGRGGGGNCPVLCAGTVPLALRALGHLLMSVSIILLHFYWYIFFFCSFICGIAPWRWAVAVCFQAAAHHKVTVLDGLWFDWGSKERRWGWGTELEGSGGGKWIHFPGVNWNEIHDVSKLAVKNGSFRVSYSVWQLLTMQPFNSIIIFHSRWGAVRTTVQLYFPSLAALIYFLINN